MLLNRLGVSVTRKTEVEKMCLARLATVEARNDSLQLQNDALRARNAELIDKHQTDRQAADDKYDLVERELWMLKLKVIGAAERPTPVRTKEIEE